jgi:hypothetical protein
MRLHDPLLPLELDVREHLLRGHRAELQQRGEQAAEMREHAAGDRAAFRFGPVREGGPQVRDGEPAVAGVNGVERATEQRTRPEHGPHGQHVHDRQHPLHGKVFEPVAQQRRARGRHEGGLVRHE